MQTRPFKKTSAASAPANPHATKTWKSPRDAEERPAHPTKAWSKSGGATSSAAEAPAQKAPCVGCTKSVTLAAISGSRPALRAKLTEAIDAGGKFLLALFDAVILEGPPTAPQVVPQVERPRADYKANGFDVGVQAIGDRAILVITAVTPDSPAARAGLEIGDAIKSVDDGVKPDNIADFAKAYARGDKWQATRLVIERGGEFHELQIPKV